MLLSFIAFTFFTMLPELSFGQSTTDFTLQKQEGDVKAYAKIDNCKGESNQTFVVKFENASATQTYEISYQLLVPNNPTFPPINGKITLTAGNSAEGNCNQPVFQGLRIPTPNGSASLNDLTINYTLTTK